MPRRIRTQLENEGAEASRAMPDFLGKEPPSRF